MILVEASVWIDFFRTEDPALGRLLVDGRLLVHSAVIGELALGRIPERGETLRHLGNQPRVVEATNAEVLTLIELHDLAGRGIGFVDAHLLAATLLDPRATALWTLDKRLAACAQRLGIDYGQTRPFSS